MSNKRIYFLLILSLLFSLNISGSSNSFDRQQDTVKQVESLRHAQVIIDMFGNKENISNQELKELAISYSIVNDSVSSVKYLDKYIRQAHDYAILDSSEFTNIKNSPGFISIKNKFKPSVDGWILFFLSSAIIGVFISVVLNFRKKGDFKANLLISMFVFFHSLLLLHICVNISKYSLSLPNSLFATTSFSLLYGPLLYFYFKRISLKYEFKIKDLIHLLPSVGLFLYFLPFYLLPVEEKLHILFNREGLFYNVVLLVVSLKYISLIGYTFFAYKVFKRLEKKKDVREVWVWKRNIILLSVFYVVTYVIYSLSLIQLVKSSILIYPQVLMMSLIIIYVAYTAYVQPRVFSKKYIFNEAMLKIKYEKSGLTQGFSEDLKEQLMYLLNTEKVYRDNEITLNSLAENLGTTRHNVSQVINEHFGVNFFHLINKYRIDEAKIILKSDFNRNLKIIDIAYDVGFNNKVTFNKAFKSETSFTPSQYIDNLNKLGVA